ncbi:peptidylprolyl isomerase [Paraflavitalea pollutisoli]|uniref:peptidylprolyl isomerase n=1 Tax=Paraflavitalea pollutisoli TaxID=3034143 RepID=UPI0023ECBDCD|nr:peptidylprolyl isomerase [Paraflavitalea sp. H1-2-19X]
MKPIIVLLLLLALAPVLFAQRKSVAQIKAELEKATNGPLYVKEVLKKRFVIDTILVRSPQSFFGLPDSLAYHGKVGKVYGPYHNGKTLVQILAKANATFNHPGQIFLDTSVFSKRFADSLSDNIIQRVRSGAASFETMAQTYSMGGEAITKGDLGWVAVGYMMPQIEQELARRKKGDLFKVWTANGVHIIRKLDDPKQDIGSALMLRIFL